MAPSAVDAAAEQPPRAQKSYSTARIYPVKEAGFEKYITPQVDGREAASAQPDGSVAIVIDNGSSTFRAGWSFESDPRLMVPPIMARYRERKFNKTFSFAGADCYADTTARGHIKNAFEPGKGIVSNWDVVEHLLDYCFVKLGLNDGETDVDVPVVMTEPVANFSYTRKSMNEILFECYGVPSVTYGIDSLFAFRHNRGSTGLVVSSSYASTHVIPVYKSKALLPQATRLNWGSWHGAEYLTKLLRLKYPTFPAKINSNQTEHMVRDFGYLAKDYDSELASFLDPVGLEDRDIVIQYPYTDDVVVQKTEEELARNTERKKESGRRLQEQAAKLRLEKLIKKEEELEYYRKLRNRLETATKKEIKRLLEAEDMKDEAALHRTVRDLEQSIKKARTKDVGGDADGDQAAPDFGLLSVPDAQLDEAGLKQKRQQRLLKSSHEARARAKAEKEAEKARVANEQRLDQERRERDLDGWLEDRRQARATTLQRIKERDRLRQDLGNRKSLASQLRMKSIANLASDHPTKKRRRGDDDTFGANDDDWGVYRSIAVGDHSDDEQEDEDLHASLRGLEQDLLCYDPAFTHEHTHDAQSDWSKSLLHAFWRGPRPFDPAAPAQLSQLHLNLERIRVPEVVFRPAIAGLDQAGLVEIVGDLLTQRLATAPFRDDLLRCIFLVGGNSLLPNFASRLRAGLTPLLPAHAPLTVRRARDPLLDPWRGAASWVRDDAPAWRAAAVTRDEYNEKGSDYLKEHNTGNTFP